MRCDTLNVRSLYTSGSLARATREYRKLRLENLMERTLAIPRCREEENAYFISFPYYL